MLKQRIITAVFLIILMLGMLFYASPPVWAIFTGIIALLTLWEYSRMFPLSALIRKVYLLSSMIIGIVLFVSDFSIPIVISISILLFWLLVIIWLQQKWVLKSLALIFIVGWFLTFPFWQALIYLRPTTDFALNLLLLMLLVWIADTGAYVFGRLFGKHKLAPKISPGKSIEGALGGMFCVLVYVTILYSNHYLHDKNISLGVVLLFAIILTTVSIYGDLFESWLKRTANIKDSSHLLPGHGGVFDRVDSLIAVLSVYSALLSILAL